MSEFLYLLAVLVIVGTYFLAFYKTSKEKYIKLTDTDCTKTPDSVPKGKTEVIIYYPGSDDPIRYFEDDDNIGLTGEQATNNLLEKFKEKALEPESNYHSPYRRKKYETITWYADDEIIKIERKPIP